MVWPRPGQQLPRKMLPHGGVKETTMLEDLRPGGGAALSLSTGAKVSHAEGLSEQPILCPSS